MFIVICTVENVFPYTMKFLFCCPQNANVKYTILKIYNIYQTTQQQYGIQ